MLLAFRSGEDPPKHTHTFNKETNNSLCVSWSCKELLKKYLKEKKSILPECNTFQARLIYSLGFRHMHLSLCAQWLQLKASLNDGDLHPLKPTTLLNSFLFHRKLLLFQSFYFLHCCTTNTQFRLTHNTTFESLWRAIHLSICYSKGNNLAPALQAYSMM